MLELLAAQLKNKVARNQLQAGKAIWVDVRVPPSPLSFSFLQFF